MWHALEDGHSDLCLSISGGWWMYGVIISEAGVIGFQQPLVVCCWGGRAEALGVFDLTCERVNVLIEPLNFLIPWKICHSDSGLCLT